ncbi:MAG: hypothetical protein AAGF92_22095 [Myxococcota bacterium]
MTLDAVFFRALGFLPLSFLFAVAGCNGSEGFGEPGEVINVGFDEGGGCGQIQFPSDEPDLPLISPPRFILDEANQSNTVGQVVARPGSPIPAQITVNQATKQVAVELTEPRISNNIIDSLSFDTPGNQTIPFEFMTDSSTRGRFYMRITLCGDDCEEQTVLFDSRSCDDDEREPGAPCGENAPYKRTLIENGEVVRVDPTCVDLGTLPGVGSGTVLIQ